MENTIELILHKEFKNKIKGYDKDDVDTFLDEIITELEKVEKKFSLLSEEKAILEKNNFELKMKLLDLEEKNNASTFDTTNLGATKLVTPMQEQEITKVMEEKAHAVIAEETVEEEPTQTTTAAKPELRIKKEAPMQEGSRDNDFTLQDRIEQLEKELNNIKSFTEN